MLPFAFQAPHIDRTDFLNGVVREKKRFENVLDEAVAAGLNAGIEVLMNQVEHIIITRTGPREYYPIDGQELDLGPTKGCREAVASLEMHCNLLKGSTSKDVLEVFYQEVGIRLQRYVHRPLVRESRENDVSLIRTVPLVDLRSILQKHLKRQIISLTGGFQIISDLNTYHAFVSSLKQARVTEDFASLKMLGHVYIVEDAKDLAQIVRDVTRYGGTYRPEESARPHPSMSPPAASLTQALSAPQYLRVHPASVRLEADREDGRKYPWFCSAVPDDPFRLTPFLLDPTGQRDVLFEYQGGLCHLLDEQVRLSPCPWPRVCTSDS